MDSHYSTGKAIRERDEEIMRLRKLLRLIGEDVSHTGTKAVLQERLKRIASLLLMEQSHD